MNQSKWMLPVFVAAAALLAAAAGNPPSPAHAQDSNAQNAAHPGPTWAEFSKLQSDVERQRQLIIQLMQSEQQRYDMLLKLMQTGGKDNLERISAAVAPAAPSESAERNTRPAAPTTRLLDSDRRTAALDGKVTVPGGDYSDIYVYVENVKGMPAKNRTVEIKQINKQFIPRLAVVQIGTNVIFPNLDPVFHNVFSNSPRNSFDLGSYRSGEKARAAVMTSPGVVDVFCNMHQKMSANILVVPSALYAKVKADGSFRIDNVPVGMRKVVVWSPNLKPTQQKVEMTPTGARTSFAVEYEEMKSHNNKFGQPYGSYKE